MESKFGFENMAKEAGIGRMIQGYEKEIQETARIAYMVRKSRPIRPAWYCPLLVRLGELMVALGSRLKTHYSDYLSIEGDAWKYQENLGNPRN